MNNVFSMRGIAAAAALAALSFSATAVDAEEASDSTVAAVPVVHSVPKSETHPLSVTVVLLNKTKLTGMLADMTSLKMQTSFGAADIPLSEVAGIRFASVDNASNTIVMLNGDSITGATEIKLMTVETEWGVAEINGSNIASIMFLSGITWEPQVGLSGDRWNLANVKKPVAPKPTTASRTTSSYRRTGSSYSRGR